MLSFKQDYSVGKSDGDPEQADIKRLLRLLVTQIECAGESGVKLTADAALYRAALRTLEATPEMRASTRTALMALRDLAWRVDSVRFVLSAHSTDPEVAEALSLLDTSDIHMFLRQEP
jgi:hypothetical protein